MISVSTLLEVIEQDHNLLSSSVCNDIISKGILNRNDLSKCGISDEFINKMLANTGIQNFEPARPLQTIKKNPVQRCISGGFLLQEKHVRWVLYSVLQRMDW